ncbi:heterokaryon incompatibility protein-domain-containing protein [Podospora fimiseda]|uniref:Heterokaryon incompatibility protein-domain-containing protein n=1 Tax=Podospora fimiseda TaxID=252190 RepID=A0AAN7H1Y2_9PEZI|nr:heterokaryon incompatibility protein-domain-containing protein [Podospora fimiseda]
MFRAPLRCRISTTSIASPIPYKALSYAWGSPTDDRYFIVVSANENSESLGALGITPSLDEALRYLRQLAAGDVATLCWIDQICINQQDELEKSAQVQLMGNIYKLAEQVQVWLGPPADDSDALMRAQLIGIPFNDRKAWADVNSCPPGNLHKPVFDLYELARRWLLPHVGYFIAWTSRRWFRRMWVAQEVSLCENTVFVCGNAVANVDVVSTAIPTLSKWVWQLDLIFALLGMASDTGKLGLRPDYTDHDYDGLLVRTANSIIRTEGLEILCWSQSAKDPRSALPSWVPDWRSAMRLPFCNDNPSRYGLFRASRWSNVCSTQTDDIRILGLKDCRIDVIETIVEYPGIRMTPEDVAANPMAVLELYCRRDEAVWRVPICDLSDLDESGRAGLNFSEGSANFFEWCRLTAPGQPSENDPLAIDTMNRAEFTGALKYVLALCAQKSWTFLTEKGYIVRCSPHTTKPGDLVVLLAGGNIPFILRPQGDGKHFKLVGDAYCDGIMDGEVWDDSMPDEFLIV